MTAGDSPGRPLGRMAEEGETGRSEVGEDERRAAAFDAVAPQYDSIFTRTTAGRWLRARVWKRIGLHFHAGMRVLELACGTGEDAVWLARQGVQVLATDASPRMLAVAQDKIGRAGMAEHVHFQLLDLADLTPVSRGPQGMFDGAFSNFGGLNCLRDRRPVAQYLGRIVRPGGRVILVVMGRWCPWEIAWHVAHGQVGTALRRLHAGGADAIVSGQRIHAWYPSPGELRRDFAPWFRHLGTFGVGSLLPPPYLGHLIERWPGPFAKVNALDERVAGWWPFNVLNDHYLVELERSG